MKIIWMGTYREDSCTRYFRRELARQAEVKFYGENPGKGKSYDHGYSSSENHQEWVEEYDLAEIEKAEKPDWFVVYCYVSKHFFWPRIKVNSLKTPIALIINDPIQDKDRILEKLRAWQVEKAFLVYWSGGLCEMFEQNYRAQYYHLPYSIDQTIFKPFQEPKIADVCFVGITDSYWYPLRSKILKDIEQGSAEAGMKLRVRIEIGHKFSTSDYVKFINSGYIFPVDGGRYEYPVAKYFEVMACNTLALGPEPLDAGLLHFKSGENLGVLSHQNIRGDIRQYLLDHKERERISENGYRTVLKYHTNEIRARYFLEMLKK